MKLWLRMAALAAALLLPIAMPASAQYMFLDSNGDGLHTAADDLNSNGTPTTVDVYVITNMNRDGSTATCDTGDGALTINSYVFELSAIGGNVTYSGFVNDQAANMPTSFGEVNTGNNMYKNGNGGGTQLATGKYKLATVTITGTSGTPSISIVPQITGTADFTSFGTACSGKDFDNTYKLGSDWQDADGLGAAGGNTNQCPVLTTIPNQTATVGELLTFTATATDADAGQTLSFSLDPGAPAGAAINASTGVFTWTPTADQALVVFTITVRVTDNATVPCSVTKTFMATVNAAVGNHCPVLAAIGDKTVTQGNQLAFTATATDADVGQILTFSLGAGAPAGATINSSTGAFTWTPTASGVFPIIVRVTDNATPACTDSMTVQVTVNAAATNQCPVLAPIGSKTVNQLSLLTFTATATDADVGQTLTFSLGAGAPAGAAINTSTGVFTWTPTASQGPGVFPVIVRVTDNGTPACTDSETVNVTVNSSSANQCPVLTPIGNKTVTAGNLLTFTATATDADVGQTLTFSLDAGAPTGAAINGSTGVFTWTPTAGQAPGVYTITVRVADNGTPTHCSVTQTFMVTVNAAGGNQCPVLASIGNKTVNELSILAFTASATDADVGQTLTFSLDSGAPAGATINSSTGVFSWTPTEAQGPGVYTITVRVTDNGTPTPCSAFESIIVVVDEVNECPVLTAIANKTVNAGQLLTFTATATDADLPANTLTF